MIAGTFRLRSVTLHAATNLLQLWDATSEIQLIAIEMQLAIHLGAIGVIQQHIQLQAQMASPVPPHAVGETRKRLINQAGINKRR